MTANYIWMQDVQLCFLNVLMCISDTCFHCSGFCLWTSVWDYCRDTAHLGCCFGGLLLPKKESKVHLLSQSRPIVMYDVSCVTHGAFLLHETWNHIMNTSLHYVICNISPWLHVGGCGGCGQGRSSSFNVVFCMLISGGQYQPLVNWCAYKYQRLWMQVLEIDDPHRIGCGSAGHHK